MRLKFLNTSSIAFAQPVTTALSFSFWMSMVLLLDACTMGPDYHPYVFKVPSAWRHSTKEVMSPAVQLNDHWWEVLDDAELNHLLQMAEHGQPTTAQAIARMEQAQASLAIEKSAQFPVIAGQADVERSNAITISSPLSNSQTPGLHQTTSTLGFNISWEPDLFGRIRRSVEMSQAKLDANNAEARATQLSFFAQIVDAWFSLRSCKIELDHSDEDIKAYQAVYQLTELRIKAGFNARAEKKLLDARMAELEANKEARFLSCEKLKDRLIALVDVTPELLDQLLQHSMKKWGNHLPNSPDFEVGLPAVLIAHRFDIVSAERQLAASNAEIGVAEASRYPSLSLTAILGKEWITSAGETVGYRGGASSTKLNVPLFDAGKGKGQVVLAQAKYQESLAKLQQQVRQAVQEVEDALVSLSVAKKREKIDDEATQAYYEYFSTAQVRYKAGLVSLLEMENTRRDWVRAQNNSVTAALERLRAWIVLVKSTGGMSDREFSQNQTRMSTPPEIEHKALDKVLSHERSS